MKWTETYIPTLREDPTEAEIVSHRLLVRAGFIRKLAAGVYNYLPLMQRVLLKISRIVREEMNRAGAQEILMPVLQPAELWQTSNRWETVGKELMKMKDRHLRDLVLGGTHEEVVTFLVRGEIRSYRQLPLNLYQIQNKFRDEIRPRFGLMRSREFLMKDAYSFDANEESFKISYKKMIDAYFGIFKRCGLDTKMVESDTGAMGGKAAHEFMVIVNTDGGENIIFFCDNCDYAANIEKATSIEPAAQEKAGSRNRLQKIPTPQMKTVEEVTGFLNVPASKLVKTILYTADGKTLAALIRGDRQINETKLKNILKSINLEMADPLTVQKITGAEVGYAGPVGLKGVKLIGDKELLLMTDFVTGANEDNYHLINVNLERDFELDLVEDIRNASPGELCPQCHKDRLKTAKGIEVGNTFMLGTKYSRALNATFIDEDGQEKFLIMGSYGVGITRTAQAAVERFHDSSGIIWPVPIAPFSVEVLPVNIQDEKQREAAFEIYNGLKDNKLEVLLDDRNEHAGVKFNDGDLIGIPLKLIIGDKNLKDNKIELKTRCNNETILVDRGEVQEEVTKVLRKLDKK
ncbi:MAG: proline--tRNA ligase [candidate division Zixibacteria bacterium]|nr:proline--tRNA ligase [candidate division Zixibacteria bacterium]